MITTVTTKRYDDEAIRRAVAENLSVAATMRQLGLSPGGGSREHLVRRITSLEIDMSHFKGQAINRGVASTRKKKPQDILHDCYTERRAPLEQLRRALKEIGVKDECSKCGLLSFWDGEPLQLELDHINSNVLDNRTENLQYLCPNCHTQLTKQRKHTTLV